MAGLGLVLVGPISLHIVNFMAYLSGAFARAMLGKSEEGQSSEAKVAVQTWPVIRVLERFVQGLVSRQGMVNVHK